MRKYKELGNLIAQLRIRAGYAQQSDLAAIMNLSQQTVSRWELGDTRPQRQHLTSLAKILRIDESKLVGEAGYGAENSPSIALASFDNLFPIDSLTPETFERFCLYFLQELYPQVAFERMGKSGHRQDGIDVYGQFEDGSRWTFQCKRVEKFGAATIKKVVEAHKMHSKLNVLLLSRIASPAAREALSKHANWELWDKENITYKIRHNLSKQQQSRLIDTFFKGQHIALLGEPYDSVWQSTEDFYAPYEDLRSSFNHSWELVGRKNDLDKLLNALAPERAPKVILLSGAGGVGKTRLMKELATEIGIKYPSSQIYFLSVSEEASSSDLITLGDGRKIIFVDDAHDHELTALFHFAATSLNTTLLLSCRPYALDSVRAKSAAAGISHELIYEHQLQLLELESAAKLSKQVLLLHSGPVHAADSIASHTIDCSLATVLASYVVAKDMLPLELVKNTRLFRDTMRGKFMSSLTGDVGTKSDAPLIKKLLTVFALIQPFDAGDDSISALVEEVERIPIPDINRLTRILITSGLLHKRGRQYRLSPEMIADFLIEESCVGVNGVSTGYAERVFDAATRDSILENLLFNVGKLDWRMTDGNTSDSRLLDYLWKRLTSKYSEPPVRAVTTVAFFQPHRAVEFGESLLRRKRCIEQLPALFRNVGLNVKYLRRACEALWEIGKNDARELNPHPNHAIRILSDLASIQYSSDLRLTKSLESNSIVIDFALELIGSDSAFDGEYTPFDILLGVLKTEGRFATSDGATWALTQYTVNPTHTILSLRDKAIDAALATLSARNSKKAMCAARFLRHSFRRPVNGDYSEEWNRDFVRTLNKISEAVSAKVPSPQVFTELLNSVRWFRVHGNPEQKARVESIHSLFPEALDYRCARALLSGSDNLFERKQDGNYGLSCGTLALVETLKTEFPDGNELREFLSEQMNQIRRALPTRSSSDQFSFVSSVLSRSEGLVRATLEHAQRNHDFFTEQFAGGALAQMFEFDQNAFLIAKAFVESGRKDLMCAVGEAYTWSRNKRELDIQDLDLLKTLLETNDKTVVGTVLSCMRMRALSGDRVVIDLAKHVDMKEIGDLAANLFEILADEKILTKFTPDDCDYFLEALLEVPELNSYGVELFLSFFSQHEAGRVANFFMARVNRAVTAEDWNYDTCFNPFTDNVQLHFRKSEDFSTIVQKVFDWIKSSQNSMFQYKSAQLFGMMFKPFDDELVHFLSQWTLTSKPADFHLLAQILAEAPRRFVLDNVDFVIQFLDKASSYGESVEKIAFRSLFKSAMSGLKSGKLGEPFSSDIELHVKTQSIRQQIPRFSSAYEFYGDLHNYAANEIQSSWNRIDNIVSSRTD